MAVVPGYLAGGGMAGLTPPRPEGGAAPGAIKAARADDRVWLALGAAGMRGRHPGPGLPVAGHQLAVGGRCAVPGTVDARRIGVVDHLRRRHVVEEPDNGFEFGLRAILDGAWKPRSPSAGTRKPSRHGQEPPGGPGAGLMKTETTSPEPVP
jgi:hypothetical protein